MESLRRLFWNLVIGAVLSRTIWAEATACMLGPALTGTASIPELALATVGTNYLAKTYVPLPFGEAIAPLTYSCAADSGTWLLIDSATGALSGTPQTGGAASTAVTVSVRDAAMPPHTNSQVYLLRVQDAAREIQLIPGIVEGTTLISGVASPSAQIRVLDVGQGDPGFVLPLRSGNAAPADAMTGIFTALLVAPLYGGQTIRLQQQSTNGSRIEGPTIQVPGIADWGRVRANFTAGIVLSSANQFQSVGTQSTLFLGLGVEKNWKWAGLTPAQTLNSRVLFNSYFDVRLTSIPVAAGTDIVSAFVTSEKSAELQGGAYLPILVSHWNWQNAPNALFIAPIAKVGFIPPTQPSANPSRFYSFYALGARAGHFKLSANSASAPEAVSYIDILAGRFSNLGGRLRIVVEGMLKIPASPFLLGFEANIGRVQAAPDDLRFFVGAKFDIGRVIAKLQQF